MRTAVPYSGRLGTTIGAVLPGNFRKNHRLGHAGRQRLRICKHQHVGLQPNKSREGRVRNCVGIVRNKPRIRNTKTPSPGQRGRSRIRRFSEQRFQTRLADAGLRHGPCSTTASHRPLPAAPWPPWVVHLPQLQFQLYGTYFKLCGTKLLLAQAENAPQKHRRPAGTARQLVCQRHPPTKYINNSKLNSTPPATCRRCHDLLSSGRAAHAPATERAPGRSSKQLSATAVVTRRRLVAARPVSGTSALKPAKSSPTHTEISCSSLRRAREVAHRVLRGTHRRRTGRPRRAAALELLHAVPVKMQKTDAGWGKDSQRHDKPGPAHQCLPQAVSLDRFSCQSAVAAQVTQWPHLQTVKRDGGRQLGQHSQRRDPPMDARARPTRNKNSVKLQRFRAQVGSTI